MFSISIVRPDPAVLAREYVHEILGDSFSSSDFAAAVKNLATRPLYPIAAEYLASIVCGSRAPGRHSIIENLVDPLLAHDLRARRVAQAVGLIHREAANPSFRFTFGDLIDATKAAPLSWLALAALGWTRGEDDTPIEFHFGMKWPPTKRERAGLALHFLCGRATSLRRGAP